MFEEYRGHSDITQGHDGRYYLVGNRNDGAPDMILCNEGQESAALLGAKADTKK